MLPRPRAFMIGVGVLCVWSVAACSYQSGHTAQSAGPTTTEAVRVGPAGAAEYERLLTLRGVSAVRTPTSALDQAATTTCLLGPEGFRGMLAELGRDKDRIVEKVTIVDAFCPWQKAGVAPIVTELAHQGVGPELDIYKLPM